MTLDDEPLTRGDFQKIMDKHEEKEERQQLEQLEKYMSAFPSGDPLKHRDYHQGKIDAAQAEKEFWQAAKLKVFEHGVSGIMTGVKIVLILALTGLAYKMGLAIPFLSGK